MIGVTSASLTSFGRRTAAASGSLATGRSQKGGDRTASGAWWSRPPTPGTLPDRATWSLVTNLPRPGGPREPGSPHPAAGLAQIVRLYSIRNWIEHGYKQVKEELGWADFQVRSHPAIRRHQVLVNCAFSFCWAAWFAHPPPPPPRRRFPGPAAERGAPDPPDRRRAGPARSGPCAPGSHPGSRCSAGGPPSRTGPARAAASPDQLGRGRPRPAPLHPDLTNHR